MPGTKSFATSTKAHLRLNGLTAFAFCVGLALLIFGTTWIHPTQNWVGVLGDQPQTMWFLGWIPYAISHGTNPLFSTAINYPTGVNLMWNTATPLLSLISWPFTTLLGPILDYNLLMTAAVALTGFTAFKVFSRYANNSWAALLGALLFEFSPYMAGHATVHLLLALAIYPLLAMVFVDEILVRQRYQAWKLGVAAGLVSVAQFFISQEVMVITGIGMASAIILMAAMNLSEVRPRLRYVGMSLGSAALVTIPFIAWPLWFQLFGPQRIHGATQPSNYFVSDLGNFLLPTEIQSLSVGSIGRMFTGGVVEATGYLGLPVGAVCAYLVWRHRRDRTVMTFALLGAILAVLSMGPYLHFFGTTTGVPLPWLIFNGVPVLNALLPVRLSMLVDVIAALLVAMFFDRVQLHPRQLIIVAGIAWLSWLPTLPFPSQPAPEASYFENAARQLPANSVLLVLPLARLDSIPMLWQMQSEYAFSMPEGSFFAPLADGTAHTGTPLNALTTPIQEIQDSQEVPLMPTDRGAMLAELYHENVNYVVVGPMTNRAQMLQLFSGLFGCEGTTMQGVVIWNVRTPCQP